MIKFYKTSVLTEALKSMRFIENQMEKDDDVKGLGNSYTTEFRMYDNRLGRWWSLDPKPTASESWYAGMGNNPIIFVDYLGDWAWITNYNISMGWLFYPKNDNVSSYLNLSTDNIKRFQRQINVNFYKVWSASVAANYVNKEFFSKLWSYDPAPPNWENEDFKAWNQRQAEKIYFLNYVFSDMPVELQKKYLNEAKNEVIDVDGLFEEMQNHGKEIIGIKK